MDCIIVSFDNNQYSHTYFYESLFLSDVELDGMLYGDLCYDYVIINTPFAHQSILFFVMLQLSFRSSWLDNTASEVRKTSFIQYLLGRDFPGQQIEPEPMMD